MAKHNRADIITQGKELLWEKGYHDTGINEILAVCQIPKGSFYNYFKSKEEFTVQALEMYGRDMVVYMESFLLDQKVSPLTRLTNMYQALCRFNADQGCTRGCLLYNLSSEVGAHNQKISSAAKGITQKWWVLIGKCVEEGQESGEIISHISPEKIAQHLHIAFNGAFADMKLQGNTNLLEQNISLALELITV